MRWRINSVAHSWTPGKAMTDGQTAGSFTMMVKMRKRGTMCLHFEQPTRIKVLRSNVHSIEPLLQLVVFYHSGMRHTS